MAESTRNGSLGYTAGFMASVACEVTVYGPGSATQPVVSVVTTRSVLIKTNCAGRPPQYAPAPCKLTFDLLTVKVASESRVTCATSVPILVLLGLSVLDLSPMYATDRQTSYAHHRLMPPPYGGGGIISKAMYLFLVAELFVFGRILLPPPPYLYSLIYSYDATAIQPFPCVEWESRRGCNHSL